MLLFFSRNSLIHTGFEVLHFSFKKTIVVFIELAIRILNLRVLLILWKNEINRLGN